MRCASGCYNHQGYPQKQMDQQAAVKSQNPGNPARLWRLRLARLLAAVYALMGWLRLQQAVWYWAFLKDLDIWPRPLYFAITGGAIGLGFTMALILMLARKPAIHSGIRILGAVFLAWFWFDRILYSTYNAFFMQLPVSLLITASTLLLAFILVRKKDFQKGTANDR